MATLRAPRLQVGSHAWVVEERSAALRIVESEVEEFSYSARNELEWLNEHMAGISNENETNFAEAFKTPGKLRGKTPKSARRLNPGDPRLPLSEIFSTTSNGPFSPKNRVKLPNAAGEAAGATQTRSAVLSPKQQGIQDSGYFGSQDVASVRIHRDEDLPVPPSPIKHAIGDLQDDAKETAATDSVEQTSENRNTIKIPEAPSSEVMKARGDIEHEAGPKDDVSPDRQLSSDTRQNSEHEDDGRSSSDGSSPLRPIVRKSSLNFASLPAREPLAAGKASGAQTSRTSQFDRTRMSHYNRQTSGKSLGGTLARPDQQEDQGTQRIPDDAAASQAMKMDEAKTYTQRLRDHINMLGQSQAKDSQSSHQNVISAPKAASAASLNPVQSTPGAFPKDDDDDWIGMTPLQEASPLRLTRRTRASTEKEREERKCEQRRPVKPTRETQTKPKQAPTVIRVNTGSQSSQYRLSTTQTEPSKFPTTQTRPQINSKVSKPSLQPKASTQSLRAAASASRSKAQELAAKKKEQEDREAQKRREAKKIERRRAAAQEEQRKQEQLKRLEIERQRHQHHQQEQSGLQSQNKSHSQRKAAIEKAKQTRAPPPAARPHQPNGASKFTMSQDSQPDHPISHTTLEAKRGPEELSHDAKRQRMSEAVDEDAEPSNQRHIRGPPVRPSVGFKKEMPQKPGFQNGYANAQQSNAPNLFKATVNAQHTSQIKAAHPLEMAQISKGAIPFAPNSNAAGSAFKTPARPGPATNAKSAVKSVNRASPRFLNGEAIELPEIQTDEDSEDEDAKGAAVAPWADSPDLRMALMRQETVDPSQIFGPPAPLNMEEVFNKSKDRFHKFRARTSSANWSGADRLTEDDIRKDLLGRDKIRRDGGWSYEMSRDML